MKKNFLYAETSHLVTIVNFLNPVNIVLTPVQFVFY